MKPSTSPAQNGNGSEEDERKNNYEALFTHEIASDYNDDIEDVSGALTKRPQTFNTLKDIRSTSRSQVIANNDDGILRDVNSDKKLNGEETPQFSRHDLDSGLLTKKKQPGKRQARFASKGDSPRRLLQRQQSDELNKAGSQDRGDSPNNDKKANSTKMSIFSRKSSKSKSRNPAADVAQLT